LAIGLVPHMTHRSRSAPERTVFEAPGELVRARSAQTGSRLAKGVLGSQPTQGTTRQGRLSHGHFGSTEEHRYSEVFARHLALSEGHGQGTARRAHPHVPWRGVHDVVDAELQR